MGSWAMVRVGESQGGWAGAAGAGGALRALTTVFNALGRVGGSVRLLHQNFTWSLWR